MPCGCKQPVIRNPKPIPQQITVDETDWFNNIDVITPIENGEEQTISTETTTN